MEHIHTQTQTNWSKHTLMPCGQEAAAGGEEVISEAQPDAAVLCWKHLCPLLMLNHSFSSPFFLFFFLIIHFISVFDLFPPSAVCQCDYFQPGEWNMWWVDIWGSGRIVSSALFLYWIGQTSLRAAWFIGSVILNIKDFFGKQPFHEVFDRGCATIAWAVWDKQQETVIRCLSGQTQNKGGRPQRHTEKGRNCSTNVMSGSRWNCVK